MTQYVCTIAALRIPTGERLQGSNQDVSVRFKKGDQLNTDDFDHPAADAAIERYVELRYLVAPGEKVEPPVAQSDFAIPLSGGPSEEEVRVVIDKANDDVGADDADDSDAAVTKVPEPDVTPDPLPEPPSKSASTEIWRQYADSRPDVQIEADANRSQIQEAVAAADEARKGQA